MPNDDCAPNMWSQSVPSLISSSQSCHRPSLPMLVVDQGRTFLMRHHHRSSTPSSQPRKVKCSTTSTASPMTYHIATILVHHPTKDGAHILSSTTSCSSFSINTLLRALCLCLQGVIECILLPPLTSAPCHLQPIISYIPW